MNITSRVRRIRRTVGLGVCLLGFAGPVLGEPQTPRGSPPITVRASPKVTMPNGWIDVNVRVDVHEANRVMRIVVESPSFYASSDFQLQGDEAARSYRRRWSDLPAGEYEVTAVVRRVDGEELHAVDDFLVVDSIVR